MKWFKRRTAGGTTEETDYEDRVEKVADISARLRIHRERNGFGKMFEAALRVPRQGGHAK